MRTNTGCAVSMNNPNYISGQQSQNDKTSEECRFECEKYEWCRGIRVKKSDDKHCRLLTNYSTRVDGWGFLDSGNWAEPKEAYF